MHTQNQTQRQLLGKSLTIFAFIAGSCASHGGSYMKEARRYPIRSNGHIVHKAKIYKAYEKHKAKQAAEESQSDKVEKVVKSQFTATSNMKGRYNLRSQAHITGNIQGNNIFGN